MLWNHKICLRIPSPLPGESARGDWAGNPRDQMYMKQPLSAKSHCLTKKPFSYKLKEKKILFLCLILFPVTFFNGNKTQKFSDVVVKRYQIFHMLLWVDFNFSELMVAVGCGARPSAYGPHIVNVKWPRPSPPLCDIKYKDTQCFFQPNIKKKCVFLLQTSLYLALARWRHRSCLEQATPGTIRRSRLFGLHVNVTWNRWLKSLCENQC